MKNSQKLIETYSDFVWMGLVSFFEFRQRKRPPVFLFLSTESKNSLQKRSEEEIDFVHHQQMRGGGATLKNPSCAWVSDWTQVPEETAHLFALTYKKEKPPEMADLYEELRGTTQHECFGRFCQLLLSKSPAKRTRRLRARIKKPEDLWHSAHQEGYFLGEEMAQAYFDEKLPAKWILGWFKRPWYSSPRSLKSLYTALKLKPVNADFL